ncbi:MAG: two-component sensor histidine kinase [Firmicutes bacterium]|nr:two-component sensor histidine kinase [Bacillota bacterium]
MYEIIDKLVLFICCLTLYLFEVNSSFYIVSLIIAVALSSLFIYYDDGRIRLAGSVFYAMLCLLFPLYIIFLPLVLYDILHTKYQYGMLFLPVLYITYYKQYSAMTMTFTAVILLVAYLLKFKADKLSLLKEEYNDLRDSSTAMSFLLEEKNQSLLKNQDYEINLATLNERNRISKEIHDNIGHLLSRALLQVGALLTIAKEDILCEGLSDLKTSLSDGMDQIRSSIHNMYDESIDLFSQIDQLVKDFTFCPIHYEYDINNSPSIQLKHAMIAITKEALSNIIHHSHATKVSVFLREHPAMYQLVIQDNGVPEEYKKRTLTKAFEEQEYGDGMGLHNISDRVKSFGGNINISVENGFKLFITFPKK